MATQTITEAVPAGTYRSDPIHSSVGFAISHNGVSTFRSGFATYEARLDGGETPRLQGTVEVESIQVDDEQLKGHLLSPEFFDAERHPQLRFRSTLLDIGEDGSLSVDGVLEAKGQSREVRARGRLALLGADLAGKARVGLSLGAAVDRRDLGLDWQAELPGGGEVLDYEVGIAVELELVAESA